MTTGTAWDRRQHVEQTLLVARLAPGADRPVAELFAESDRTELPGLLGVTGRRLFRYHGLYFHLIESEPGLSERLERHRQHPLFTGISAELGEYISAYDPSWQRPRDAMATEFYRWHTA
jgi:hypothetical protein